MSNKKFHFIREDHVGANGAEEDGVYLRKCFVDTGYVDIALDLKDHRQVVVGRTGVGKTALFTMLADRKLGSVIFVSPEGLALSYVSNSTILNYLAELGVNFDPFFKLLWRHVLAVELLRYHFDSHPEPVKRGFLDRLRSYFAGGNLAHRKLQKAIDYLGEWGDTFWEQTDYRVKELTQKIEHQIQRDIGAKLSVSLAEIGASRNSRDALSEEQRIEVKSRAQEVVSAAQVHDLNELVQVIDAVLDDRQKQYYLVIDGLDENWVDERIRYKLIMALLVASKDFIPIRNAKVLIGIRRDLLDRVFRLCRDSGFQEEKFQSLYLPIKWTEKDLLEVLHRRVVELTTRHGTGRELSFEDLLPDECDGIKIHPFLLSRVDRPRDVIAFFNACIGAGLGKTRLKVQDLKNADREYSRLRLRALGDEWSGDYPLLLSFVDILKGRAQSFKVAAMTLREVEDLSLTISIANPNTTCVLGQQSIAVAEGRLPADTFRTYLVQSFYKIGLVGLKVQPFEATSWAMDTAASVSRAEITDDTSIEIHAAYQRSLGIIPSRRRSPDGQSAVAEG